MCSCVLSYFTYSFIFHCFSIIVFTQWCIDLFSCTAARVSNEPTYLLTNISISCCSQSMQLRYLDTIFGWIMSPVLAQIGSTYSPHNCWQGGREESRDPRDGHAHRGHPVATVLPMSNRMDNLEVSFQRDDNKTDLSARHNNDQLSSKPLWFFFII